MEELVSICSPRFGYPLKPITWINAQAIARRIPQLMREISFDMGTSDKVFSSQWLSEYTVLLGTKCNKLFVLDILNGNKVEIPRLTKCSPVVQCNTLSCGIHCIRSSPGGSYVATGGHLPNYLALYTLPDLVPLAMGEAHTDWIFDMQWLSNSLLITASRDATMALWSVPTHYPVEEYCPNEEDHLLTLAENVPVIKPIFHFSNTTLTSMGDRVRGLAYNEHCYELASLQTSNEAVLYFWDVFVFQPVSHIILPYCAENVCIQVDSEGTLLYAVGSRSHVTLLDPRESHDRIAWNLAIPDTNCGVRSLAFNQQLLSVGTGAGHLFFYDMRARDWLMDKSGQRPCTFTASGGWLQCDHTFQDGFPSPPSAIYTHNYSPLRTKIFTAGGPLLSGLCGNYASMWI